MASTIKVNNIQNQCGANIINESANTITIGASGDTISLAAGASQTGFGRTGTVDWDTTAKTASFTAVSGNGYFVNTTSGAITVTLPAGSAGDIVSLADYTNTWQTNNVTITPNGSDKIGGVNEDAILSTEGQSVTFVFVDSTEGWKNVQDSTSNITGLTGITATGGTITYCGNCKIHTFTSPGTFCVSALALSPANNEVSYMVVGGGGGGGGRHGGGGGAGGFREDKSPVTSYTASPLDGAGPITVTASPYPISIGAGGTGGFNYPSTAGTNGGPSVFSTITSAGGGYAATYQVASNSGGSGGGGAQCATAGGSGNTPPVSPPQGNPGGTGGPNPGAGGGGAAAQGSNQAPTQGGPGGAGATTGISGTSTAYAGGGGGGNYCTTGAAGVGGIGGGGPGGGGPPGSPTAATAGTANTGGGGGGYGGTNPDCNTVCRGATGGSGIVIIRYKIK